LQLARRLWQESRSGILSTRSLEHKGYPFGSLAPYSLDHQGRPLLLLAHLAQHTRNLQAEPGCSLTLVEPGQGDVQQLARLTALARAEAINSPSEALLERHFHHYPDSRPYFEQLNFRFYRLIPERFYFIGGFGAARWFNTGQILDENKPTEQG
jgi:putative heme iron utilization protein